MTIHYSFGLMFRSILCWVAPLCVKFHFVTRETETNYERETQRAWFVLWKCELRCDEEKRETDSGINITLAISALHHKDNKMRGLGSGNPETDGDADRIISTVSDRDKSLL